MRYIGIDVSKETLDIFIPPDNHLKLENSDSGFCHLDNWLIPEDVIGMESTGNYHQKLALHLLDNGNLVKILNPIIVNQFIRATVRKKKTDKTDAVIISKLIAQGEGNLCTHNQLCNKLRKIYRTRHKLIQYRSSLKILLKTTKTDAETYPTIEKSYENLIQRFDEEVCKLETISRNEITDQTILLESIPGISPNFARIILGEIGDIDRFSRSKQIVAYAGLDPKVTQSGHSINRKGHITKRGSSLLRHTLFLIAFANINRNNVFGDFYRKKKSEGKHYYQAMTATSRKILEVSFSILKNNSFFV